MFWSEWITEVLRGSPFDRAKPVGTSKVEHRTVASITAEEATEVCAFLQTWFGSPPNHPRFVLTESELFLGPSDWILFLRCPSTHQLLGTLRYRFMGTLNNAPTEAEKDVSVVDCFCVHPAWRGKGVGDQLLTALHRLANPCRRPYALFVKEGSTARIPLLAAYTGSYVYRRLSPRLAISDVGRGSTLLPVPVRLAHRLLRVHHQVYPDRFLLFPGHTRNQWWFLYRSPQQTTASILIGIQDSYQRAAAASSNGRMAWMTAWLPTTTITSEDRRRAIQEISQCPVLTNRFDWIWADRNMIGTHAEWKDDGVFQWYTYQWNTDATFQDGYSFCA